MEMPLGVLALGEHAYISRVTGKADMVCRLTELGFLPGTRVHCELISPSGDPAAYRVRGGLIALRRQDADTVWVTGRGEEQE